MAKQKDNQNDQDPVTGGSYTRNEDGTLTKQNDLPEPKQDNTEQE